MARATFSHERTFGRDDGKIIAGIDEVGRGPLAGPGMACALVLPATGWPAGLADSKALTAIKREKLSAELRTVSLFGLGSATVEEIDRINILQATFLAMQRAMDNLVKALGRAPDHALIDGNRCPKNL